MLIHACPVSTCHCMQDHTLYKKKGRTECPPEARCLNCMPKPGKDDEYECWAIKKPVMYKVGVDSH